jgi:hypothetical protein
MPQRARSQALIEFALVIMLFLTLLFAIFDYGMVLSDWVSATTASSVGARQAAVGACFVGLGSDPTICPTQNTTSVVGAVVQSAPLLAAYGNCQNAPLPGSAFRCISRTDVALIDTNAQQASCEDVEVWASSQTAQSGSTATVIHTLSIAWPANSLVGGQLTFVGGANNNMSRTITANSATTITPGSAFPYAPAAGDSFEVTVRRLAQITAGWISSCSTTPPNPQLNDTLMVVVHTQVDVPAPLPPLPTTMQVESWTTVRFEGEFLP